MLQKTLDIPFLSEFPASFVGKLCNFSFALANFSMKITSYFSDGVWKYFQDKCAENLHVVLSMSPSGESLRNFCRSFPGLIGNTTIDWIFPWPQQALKSVARGYIGENRKIPDSLKEHINDHVVFVHESMHHYTKQYLKILRRQNYITPKHYLDYVTTYIRLLDEKCSFITKQIARYTDGIRKIDDASAQIDLLREEVKQTKEEATNAVEECDNVMDDIENCKLQMWGFLVCKVSVRSLKIGHIKSTFLKLNYRLTQPSLETNFLTNFYFFLIVDYARQNYTERKRLVRGQSTRPVSVGSLV
jgi:hypothetical protein